jgi:wobble nucleotide-excising tRNase
MITQISLQNVATFGSEVQTMSDLKKLNFVFGTNGSGKTTISRVLRAPDDYSSCAIVWENEKRIPCKVYNSDFVAENFRDDSDMPGIFTLGKEELETKSRIQQIQDALRKLESTQEEKKALLKGTDGNGGKAGALVALEKKYTNKFWEQKQKYDSSPIKFGMEGCLSSKERFRSELLNQFSSNREPPYTFEELSKRAETAFGDSPQTLSEISIPNFVPLLKLSESTILSKRIVGKEDIDISALIKKLNNSDWVKAGMAYLEKSEGYCPFCQKQVPHNLTEQLSEYFDDAYSEALKELSDLAIRYTSIGSQLLNQLKFIGQQNTAMLDVQTFNAAVTLLEKTIEENKRKIDSKRQNPSNSIVLVDYGNLPDELVNLVKDANKKIAEHNLTVSRISDERRTLKKQIWKFIVNEASSDIALYKKEKKNLENEIESLESKIKEDERQRKALESKLRTLQSTLTSVIPTKNLINGWLKEFGFTGFQLAVSSDEHSYSLIRDDGTPVNKSLSEGERNFVTFLYFYALLKGSQDNSGNTPEQIVVIDDPVSSMDSEVLFIVSTLIHELYEGICNNSSNIKQLVVLSHNLYFYKEVTFFDSLPKKIRSNRKQLLRYWVVRKHKGISQLYFKEDNPVQSTYEILWSDVREASKHPDITNSNSLQNTMRRILEHYYKYYGGVSLNKLPEKVGGEYRWIVKTLLAWTNDGSHSKFEDICCAPIQENSVELYLNAFRLIFEQTEQIAHYNMMMRL